MFEDILDVKNKSIDEVIGKEIELINMCPECGSINIIVGDIYLPSFCVSCGNKW